METLPEMTEAEDTVLDTNAKIPLYDMKVSSSQSGNHLDVPDSVSLVNKDANNVDHLTDTESTEGIVFHVPEPRENDALLAKHENNDNDDIGDVVIFLPNNGSDEPYVPALPSYSDSGAFLSKYANQPMVDYREPKQLTEKNKEDLIAAKRWRSFSIESAGGASGDDGVEDVNNEQVDNQNHRKPDDVTVEIRSPWSDSPSSTPPRSYMDEFGSGTPRRSERSFNSESRF